MAHRTADLARAERRDVHPTVPTATRPAGRTDVEIVVPVHNEERDLGPSVRRLEEHLRTRFPFPARIVIADNASTDGTWAQARALAERFAIVDAVRLEAKGRGRALRETWSVSDAAVVAYMDVDLSTDLNALLPLVAPLLSGHSDVAIGSRLTRSSRVVRGPRREVVSRCYNLLLRTALRVRFSDAQCGFKALRADCARVLLPHVQDTSWFFDTELLVLAERSGLRIAEVPVDWVDDPDSRVDLVATAVADLRGVVRMARALARGRLPLAHVRAELGRTGTPGSLLRQASRLAAMGALSTAAYLLLFVLWRGALGVQAADLLALLVTAVANTAADRRVTFGLSVAGAWRHRRPVPAGHSPRPALVTQESPR